jgi:hypothetical protein
MRRVALVTALLALLPRVHADEPPLAPLVAPPASDADRLKLALQRFEFGDYEAVVAELGALVELGAHSLERDDRLEALRAYGIACAMTGRPTAAEGAFGLLVDADPNLRLDPALVRPEAVSLFERVRTHKRDTLLAAYRKGRRKRYAVLNLLPPAGQMQNRQYGKGYAVLGFEIALLALDVTSGSLLYAWQGDHKDFPGHEDSARKLRPLNWVSFGALLSVVLYGVIDGFVVGHRRDVEERELDQKFLRGSKVSLSLDSNSTFGIRF